MKASSALQSFGASRHNTFSIRRKCDSPHGGGERRPTRQNRNAPVLEDQCVPERSPNRTHTKMAETTAPVDSVSTTTPLDQERASGRSDTAQTTDKFVLALQRQFEHATSLDHQHRVAKLEAEAKAKALKDLGLKPGEPVTADALPLTRELAEKAVRVLQPRKLKAGEFQEGMEFFNPAKLAPVRKALLAAGITEEHPEGSVVFVALTEEFQPKAKEDTSK